MFQNDLKSKQNIRDLEVHDPANSFLNIFSGIASPFGETSKRIAATAMEGTALQVDTQ